MEKNPYREIWETEIWVGKIWQPKTSHSQNIIHNFSSHKLTPEEEHALSFSLDDHIPVKQNDIKFKQSLGLFTTTYLSTQNI